MIRRFSPHILLQQDSGRFSKIQARFKTRVKLTSADVEEVIRKRLLEKNDKGTQVLRAVYGQESANFKTLFDFVDGAKTYRNYTDEAHFVGTYPFVSYQFPLFQAAIEGLSDHNVFEGRNSSVGERSMLGVVQQVAKDIGEVEIGSLATFDAMFAGIRASLKSAAQRSIDRAERDLTDSGSPVTKLAVQLLKALFLVKYVESFQATPAFEKQRTRCEDFEQALIRFALAATIAPMSLPEPLLTLQQATRLHQQAHGCSAHVFDDGPGLWQLLAQHQPERGNFIPHHAAGIGLAQVARAKRAGPPPHAKGCGNCQALRPNGQHHLQRQKQSPAAQRARRAGRYRRQPRTQPQAQRMRRMPPDKRPSCRKGRAGRR